jgi:hypothetical protein
VKFAHLADCHIGGWREPRLRDLNLRSFAAAMDRCLLDKVDFVLIAGDLFNTALPDVNAMAAAVQKMRQVRDAGIAIYVIPGSHDYSPSGKTMLDVLEQAGLFTNVVKGEEVEGRLRLHFTVDPRTGAKITGLLGRRGGLEKDYFGMLDREALEREPGFKIFMFHTALAEFKPAGLEEMDAMPVSLLPKGFDYYAGGHVHVVDRGSLNGYRTIVYPGPVFPNNFAELEKLRHGGFCIWRDGQVEAIPLKLHPVESITLDCTAKHPPEVQELLKREVGRRTLRDAILTVRLQGRIEGRVADISFTDLHALAQGQGCLVMLKNTAALESKEYEVVPAARQGTVEDVEASVIREHAVGQGSLFPPGREAQAVQELMAALAAEKDEGERTADFERRLVEHADRIIGLELAKR